MKATTQHQSSDMEGIYDSHMKSQPSQAMPLRAIRIPDHIWQPAMERAVEEGQPLSAVIRKMLLNYSKRRK